MSRSAAFWGSQFGTMALSDVPKLSTVADVGKWALSTSEHSGNAEQTKAIAHRFLLAKGPYDYKVDQFDSRILHLQSYDRQILGHKIPVTNVSDELSVLFTDIVGPKIENLGQAVLAAAALQRLANNIRFELLPKVDSTSTTTVVFTKGEKNCVFWTDNRSASFDKVIFGNSLPTPLTYGVYKPVDVFNLARDNGKDPIDFMLESTTQGRLGITDQIQWQDLKDMVRFEYTKHLKDDFKISRRDTVRKLPKRLGFETEADKQRLEYMFEAVELKAQARLIRQKFMDGASPSIKLPENPAKTGQTKGDCGETTPLSVAKLLHHDLDTVAGVTLKWQALQMIKGEKPQPLEVLKAYIPPCGLCTDWLNLANGHPQYFYNKQWAGNPTAFLEDPFRDPSKL